MILQDFRKEEQNFVFINEIDNMALIMPSADKHSVAVASASGDDDDRQRLKRSIKRPDHLITSLNVASLKRLLPIGLNMFGGQEQELVQQAKQRLIEVSQSPHSSPSHWVSYTGSHPQRGQPVASQFTLTVVLHWVSSRSASHLTAHSSPSHCSPTLGLIEVSQSPHSSQLTLSL